MQIEILSDVDNKTITAFNRLMQQLSSNYKPIAKEYLIDIINSSNIIIFVAKENETIIGSLSLVFYNIPTGMKAWVEDVVIDQSVRGKGVGKALIEQAIVYAKQSGASKLDLTSSPERVAANKLYQKLNFEKRETNVYRLML
ncbi:MAG: GNAT family N-acetyltransferase [Dysgonomonas sp.]